MKGEKEIESQNSAKDIIANDDTKKEEGTPRNDLPAETKGDETMKKGELAKNVKTTKKK